MDSDRKDELAKLVEGLKNTRQSRGFTEREELGKKERERIATQPSKAPLSALVLVTGHKELKSLYSKILPARHTSIVEAHRKTFDWDIQAGIRDSHKVKSNH